MNTQEALDYLSKNNNTAENENAVEETSALTKAQPEDETTKSEGHNEDKGEVVDDKADTKVNDVTKVDDKSDDLEKQKTNSNHSQKEKRDYAFARLKNQSKELKERIKQLESELEKRSKLSERHFHEEGSDKLLTDKYVDFRLQNKDMEYELNRLKEADRQNEEQQYQEQFNETVERCFKGQDLDDFRNLISEKGKMFTEVVSKYDPNNAFFNYLETMPNFPVVLREIMTNPNPYMGKIFRSSDPESIRYNTMRVVNDILDNYAPKVTSQGTQQSKTDIPIMGKQITNNNVSNNNVHDRNYWNQLLHNLNHRR